MTGAVLTMILPPRGGPATPEGRALRRPAGGGEISDPCTGRQVRCLIKKYRLRYGVSFSGSDGVGSSEETGPGIRGEVMTGKEMINTLNEGKFVCRRVKGPAAYL